MLSRRTFVAAGLSSALIAPALAAKSAPGVYRMKVGDYRLTAIYDGLYSVRIDGRFMANANRAEVNRELVSAHLPPNRLPISVTALLVETGSKRILIDTGTAGQIADTARALMPNLAAAGVSPREIDTVLISHFHPDHIDGLKDKDGAKVFPNAEILVPEPEWAFWMDDGNEARAKGAVLKYFRNARRIFADIAKEVRQFKPGTEVAPGIVSIPAYGHTPGHTAFAVSSGGASLLVMSDTVRNPYLFARHPDWQPSFDMDGPQAAAARLKMLDQAASDRMLVEAYHFPFPATGHIAKTKTGYELVPLA